jgi:histidine triad (HIT) family protein
MSKNCIFCKIVMGEILSRKVYENESVLAFKDMNPQAPVHIIVIPKKHISGLIAVSRKDVEILGYVQLAVVEIAKKIPEMENGFRLVNNCGTDGGQMIFHIHYHLLGGRAFTWPPG